MLSLQNQQIFDKKEFGESRIKNTSVLNAQFSHSDSAIWTPTYLELSVLEDEVDLLQIG